jgi:hypothetical protein
MGLWAKQSITGSNERSEVSAEVHASSFVLSIFVAFMLFEGRGMISVAVGLRI